MAGHEKLFCHDCFTTFEVAWSNNDANDIEDELTNCFEVPEYCPFCGSQDIDDPIYTQLDDEAS